MRSTRDTAGNDEGARGAEGTLEKNLTLAVARRLKNAVEGRLGIRVLLTRDEDRAVPIDERSAIANNSKADLFISLHANAAMRAGPNGASVHVAAFADVEDARASLAPERVPAFGGTLRDIELVPWNLAQIRYLEQSTVIAGIIEQALTGRVKLDGRSPVPAPYRVLESANMPAVLIEMGYLTNPDQEKAMAGAEFQNALVQAIIDGIVDLPRVPAAEPGGWTMKVRWRAIKVRGWEITPRRAAAAAAMIAATAGLAWLLFIGAPRWSRARADNPAAAVAAAEATPGRKNQGASLLCRRERGQAEQRRARRAVRRRRGRTGPRDHRGELAPVEEPLLSAVPAGTTLRAIFVTPQGQAYLDLSGEVAKAHPGGSLNELLTVYTLVDALTVNLPAIVGVQLLVDGREVGTLAGHIDLGRPLVKNLALVE